MFKNSFKGYVCPEYVVALFEHIIKEIERVYWNRNQKKWNKEDDVKIPKIKHRPYYEGEDEKEIRKPNFTFDIIKLRWSRNFGREMTSNKEYTVAQWRRWFDRCLKQIRKYEDMILNYKL